MELMFNFSFLSADAEHNSAHAAYKAPTISIWTPF